MKKTFLLLAVLMANLAISQSGLVIGKTPVKDELTPILIHIPIEGMVEFDGHTFDNNKTKSIKFKATIDGITIYDDKREYTHRKCSVHNCKIIHLEQKSYQLTISNSFYKTNTLN